LATRDICNDLKVEILFVGDRKPALTTRIAIGCACALITFGAVRLCAQYTQSGNAATASTPSTSPTATSTANSASSTNSGSNSNSTGSAGSAAPSTTASLNAPSPQQSVTNPSSLNNPYYGSVTIGTVSSETLQLSLDDAIQRGIQANLALTQARIQQQQSDAQRLESRQPLLATITAEA